MDSLFSAGDYLNIIDFRFEKEEKYVDTDLFYKVKAACVLGNIEAAERWSLELFRREAFFIYRLRVVYFMMEEFRYQANEKKESFWKKKYRKLFPKGEKCGTGNRERYARAWRLMEQRFLLYQDDEGIKYLKKRKKQRYPPPK